MNSMIIMNNEVLTMSSIEIADLVQSRHDSVKRTIERCAEKGAISLPPMVEVKIQRERREEMVGAYCLCKRDSLIVVAQLCPEFTAAIVDRWQELEEASKPQYAIPQTLTEALRLAADLAERTERAELERDVAVATKTLIGNRREATAMNTASQAIKKAAKLEVELDKSRQYATVKRMEMLCHGQKFNWRLLKSTAIQMNIPPIDVFDANYGSVKSYHTDVWKEAYALDIESLDPLEKAA